MKLKSILISIRPKWCELIASGEKTIEVRKTRPKIEAPFKCYIYCTNDYRNWATRSNNYEFWIGKPLNNISKGRYFCNGKVIGEFVCDGIMGAMANNGIQTYYNGQKGTCLSDAEIIRYAGGKKIYYWHISDLKIYDKPKELGDFWKAVKCLYATENDYTYKYHCFRAGQKQRCGEELTRPPQSWRYVEEIEDVTDLE